MKHNALAKFTPLLPAIVGGVALLCLALWLTRRPDVALELRQPGADNAEAAEAGKGTNPVYLGKLILSNGVPSNLPGEWSRFRGADLTAISREKVDLAKTWGNAGPPQLWSTDVGEGYAGAAVRDGRVYLMDYDQKKKQDALRCLSLADGQEIWRFAYPVSVKRNHGMSRTVPTLAGDLVIAMGPKCHVICLDAKTGQLRWGIDLVQQFGTTIPQWYAGQCPLVEGDKLILAPGGTNALLAALNITNAQVLWTTPNPKGWQMTHSSVMPMVFKGGRQYVYCASQGVVGVDAADGKLLWDTPDWKISIANVPSPVTFEDGRIFLSGGYNAGSMMLQLAEEGGKVVPKTLFKLPAKVFGATQHTPIYHQQHLFAIREDGQLVCLDLTGKVVWASGTGHKFGLGPFIIANDLIYALSDSGTLKMVEATPAKFNLLAQAQVLHGHEAWGPLALAGGRLIARDVTRMVCLDVAVRQ